MRRRLTLVLPKFDTGELNSRLRQPPSGFCRSAQPEGGGSSEPSSRCARHRSQRRAVADHVVESHGILPVHLHLPTSPLYRRNRSCEHVYRFVCFAAATQKLPC